jgi:flagellar assembly factor FliW
MQIKTSRFGILEKSEDEVITFPKGIPGLESFKTFIIIPAETESSTFFFLQSTEKEDLALFLLNPFQLFKDYEVKLDAKSSALLKAEDSDDVVAFTVITVNGTIEKSTTNLKAPIMINVKKNRGVQMIIENKNYEIKQPLAVN